MDKLKLIQRLRVVSNFGFVVGMSSPLILYVFKQIQFTSFLVGQIVALILGPIFMYLANDIWEDEIKDATKGR